MTWTTDNNPSIKLRRGLKAAAVLQTFRAAERHYARCGMSPADATRVARVVVMFQRTRANGRPLDIDDFDVIAAGAV